MLYILRVIIILLEAKLASTNFISLYFSMNCIYLPEVFSKSHFKPFESSKYIFTKNDFLYWSPSRYQTWVTLGLWAQDGSSSWCAEQPRRTALAVPLQSLGCPSLPSWCPGQAGPRDVGSLATWFLPWGCWLPQRVPNRACSAAYYVLCWAVHTAGSSRGCGWQHPLA